MDRDRPKAVSEAELKPPVSMPDCGDLAIKRQDRPAHWKRQPRRSRGCASIRMPRLSHKAVLGEVADRAAPESIGGVRINRTRRHGGPLGQCTQEQCPLIQL
jgi:hypothetical protein